MKIAVITVSDRAAAGKYSDRSGPAVEEVLRRTFPEATLERALVPDEKEDLLAALEAFAAFDWVLTTGGTGPSGRDITPETTRLFCEREVPGLAEYLRRKSFEETPNAVFSRLFAGQRGRLFVVNFPGSERAARFCAETLAPLMAHGTEMAAGGGHEETSGP